jgi:organic hydroperoxide reductase OsmC/OhrA
VKYDLAGSATSRWNSIIHGLVNKLRSLIIVEINATIRWQNNDEQFSDSKYSRKHTWEFDGGAVVHASSSPAVVPVPMSDPHAVDPEEALVAAISSCHMLWFLAIAAKKGFSIDEYCDNAIGQMGKNHRGQMAITEVTLRPRISWDQTNQPTETDIREMHDRAYEKCFIANSVTANITVQQSGPICNPDPV